MVERRLDRDHDLEVMLKPGLTERWRFLHRFVLAAWSRCRRHRSRRLLPAPHLGQALAGGADHPAVARGRGIQDGPLQPGGPARIPQRPCPQVVFAAIVSSEFDVPFYAEAFGIPEERVIPTGIPRMDRFFDEEAPAKGLAAARSAFPGNQGPDDDPLRADIPRRHDPRGVLRLRAARLRGAPRVVRRARCRGHHHPARAFGDGGADGGVHGARFVHQAERVQHQGHRRNRTISDVPARERRCRAVHRLDIEVFPGWRLPGRGEPEAALQGRAEVGDDVAEQIVGDDDFELAGLCTIYRASASI